MKKLFFLFLLLTSALIASAQKETSRVDTILTDGVKRTYIIYIPAIYNGSTAVPLLLNFHGLGSNASSQYQYSNFQPIADTANFIMVVPEGLLRFGTTGWNCFGDPDPGIDDIRFISHLIDTLKKHYNINLNRVYSTGFSNGGFMSHELACYMSNRIAAIGSVSGTMMQNHLDSWMPRHPTPVMHIHGTLDQVVLYTGQGGTLFSAHVDSVVMKWVRYNNCSRSYAYTALPDINTSDGCTAEHYVYPDGRGGSSVELYKITGGGHSWPGSPYGSAQGNTDRDFSASEVIWNFLSKYDKSMSIDEDDPARNHFSIYPNPATIVVTVATGNNQNEFHYLIYDIFGKEVSSGMLVGDKTEINISALSAGVYFLKTKESASKTYKIIKSN